MDTTMTTTTDRATERELQVEVKRRARVLADAERELADLQAALPALVAEHGVRLDALREHETRVYHELKAVESPKQAYTFIEPLWRRENPRADAVLGEHQKLNQHARELQQDIDSKSGRAYQLREVVLPQLRGWAQEAVDVLETYKVQIAEAVERERKGETQPISFDQIKRRVLGRD